MTKREILDKAIYICYPKNYTSYTQYNIEEKVIHKLPLPPMGMMYDAWKSNVNHFINAYHRKYSLPLLESLLNFGYQESDFCLEERYSQDFDMSMLYPKQEMTFDIYGYNKNEYTENVNYDELIQNKETKYGSTDYHRLYKYPHECSRIINKTINNNRVLLISGDSQMIPDIPVLACYFKEVWYFDNRDGVKAGELLKDVNFTDVLIELNCSDIKQYTETNITDKQQSKVVQSRVQDYFYYTY